VLVNALVTFVKEKKNYTKNNIILA